MLEFNKVINLMGTKITLYFHGPDAEKTLEDACIKLEHYEKIFSANSENSDLILLKKKAPIEPQKVDSELYELIKIGREHSLSLDSHLNIAIGPLIKLWRVGFEDANIPEQNAILDVLDLLKPENILLEDNAHTVYFARDGMEIDLGAIAKGFFCDKIMNFFKEKGALSAMIDIGGNVLVFGDSPKGKSNWNVGIQNPFMPRGKIVAAVKIRNQSVVTSGVYERVLNNGDKTYHHIFDSKTGYPIENNIASLTIIADHSLDCDLYTTKLFGYNLETIIQRVETIEGMDAIVITLDGKIAYTNNLKDKITFNLTP